MSREMMALTMSIVGNVLFQTDVLAETDELGAALSTALAYINYILSSFFPLPLNWPTERNRRTRQALDLLNRRMQKMIEERRASGEQGDDFLSILLRARDEDGAPMGDQQIKDEALTLFVAGHETTAAALTWTWFLLAEHPDIYQRLRDEVDTVLQGHSPTYADLARLPYTLQVLKESMRLYPPSIALVRVALRPVDLGPYHLRRGQTIMIVPYTIQRRPDYFPDPERFNPDHFRPENEARLPRFAYLPFGAGPRICIGNHFALMEGHLLLAALAQRVSFSLLPGQQIIPDNDKTITIRPRYGLKMRVQRRSQPV
ncbi:cytochrome P450 [Dictyobacter halimunensis]